MPAGRRIIINVSEPGTRNDQGESVPGAATALGVWARRRDVSQERKLERQGTRDETSLIKVEDGAHTFSIINMVEVTEQGRGQPDLRKRWIDLQGIRSS